MGNVNDMLDEIMSDLGISDELARSIRQTEEKSNSDKPESTVEEKDTGKKYNTTIPERNNDISNRTTRVQSTKNSQTRQKTTQKQSPISNNSLGNRNTSKKNASKGKILSKRSMLKISIMSLHILINIVIYTLAVIAIVKVSEAAYDFAYQIYGDVRAEDEPGQKVSFEIDEGTTSLEVAKQLENNDLIIDKYAFLIRLKLSEKEIYANTYMLSTSMTYDEIIDTICNYKSKDNKTQTNNKDAEDVRQL